MQTITPFLWFNNEAEEAMKFYTSIFKKSKMGRITRYGGGSKGKVMSVTFSLLGQDFMALNGGPHFKFTEAISLFVNCKTQKEVDYYWNRLSKGGEKSRCGWLKDKFGLSWQIIPEALGRLLGDKNPAKAGRALEAMLKMSKIDIRKLQKAHDGK